MFDHFCGLSHLYLYLRILKYHSGTIEPEETLWTQKIQATLNKQGISTGIYTSADLFTESPWGGEELK